GGIQLSGIGSDFPNMAQQSSRLNRLLTLLDTGSTQATKFSAARQIGEIAKSHPQDLNALLNKMSQYLRSKKWETRVAAAHAVGAIAENVKHISLTELSSSVESKISEAGISATFEDVVTWPNFHSKLGGSISFQSFDLNKVLEFGALVASGGQQLVDTVSDDESSDNDRDGSWPFQGFVEQLFVDMFDPVWEVRHGSIMSLREILTYQGASAGILMPEVSNRGVTVSNLNDKDNESEIKKEGEIDLNMLVSLEESGPVSKRPKIEDAPHGDTDVYMKGNDGQPVPTIHNGIIGVRFLKMESQSGIEGTYHSISDASVKKECLEGHELSGKMNILKNLPQNSELMNLLKYASTSWLRNFEFLQDCAIRFLCILSLDRFGDYVSDQVVAPVRETCAQALGAVLKYMHPSLVQETLNILLKMQLRPEWEIRHGSLLGIKYLVAVRQEMLHNLLDFVLPACKAGLEDPDDDVRAVAAEALIPTSASIVSLKGSTLHSIVMLLWDILLDLDDLSPSTSSVMNLLAEIYSQEQMIPKTLGTLGSKESAVLNHGYSHSDYLKEGMSSLENPYMLSTLAPRLWPFMRHNISSVRLSAIRTLERLLEAGYRRSVSDVSSSLWPSFIVGDTLRIVFQNLLLESNEEILQCSKRVWNLLLKCLVKDLENAAKLYFSSWIELATTPYGSPLDATKMFWPVALPRKSHFKAAAKMKGVGEHQTNNVLEFGWSMSGENGDASTNSTKIIVGADLDISVTYTRVITSSALGILASKLNGSSLQCVIDPLWKGLTSFSGVQRQASGLYSDLVSSVKLDIENMTADDAVSFASLFDFMGNCTPMPESEGRILCEELESLKQKLLTTAGYLNCVQNNLHLTVSALLAAAVVWMSELPAKLNPIILPIMSSIKREQEEILQCKAAESLAELIHHCIERKPGPNDKLIKNLCNLTCVDPRETPQAGALNSVEIIEDQDLLSSGSSSGRQKSKVNMFSAGEDRSKVEGFISRRGSELALKYLCMKFGSSLFDRLPKIWHCLVEVLKPCDLEGLTPEDEKLIDRSIASIKDPQILINNIQVVRSIAPFLEASLRPKLLTLLPCIFRCVRNSHIAVRLSASRCITAMAKSMTLDVMGSLIENVVPMLGDIGSVHARQGAGMLVSLLVQGLGLELVPYAPLLVVPLLRCMSDCDHSVRQSVTHSFAALVPLLPLARGVSLPVGLTDRLSQNQEDALFLEQLVDNSHIDDYKLPFELKVTLRRYQQEGVNWLAFLKRFNLHGILCDDMGLGKTLQSSAIVASAALQYLLKLCSHPLLVLGDSTPDSLVPMMSELGSPNSDISEELHKIHHSPKLVALQEIMEECGIGVDASSSEGPISIGQHRLLIFAQHKAFLDIIEKDLFHTYMKTVAYLRLDGSVEPEKRFEIVKAFNSDPTIDALLLTTHVGGLGLNLTSADTLVFMEHDWNPMRDHQAMDRAHRLGQRKVVNVHRLIMRGTLEEKVMSLQKFKVSVANAVINSDNASMNTMNTDQLLDLFTSADGKRGVKYLTASGEDAKGRGKGLKAILGGLEELWDQSQYTEEYNLNQFLAKLNG
ncbi:TATA-binding protein-associated factor, partial [Striga asiatica]